MHLYSVAVTTLSVLSLVSGALAGGWKEANLVGNCTNLPPSGPRYALVQGSCTKYYNCASKSKKPVIYECKSGKQFNKATNKCDIYNKVRCKDGKFLSHYDTDNHDKRSEYLNDLYTDYPRSSRDPNDISEEIFNYSDLKLREDSKSKFREDLKKRHEDSQK